MDPTDKDPDPDTLKLSGYPIRSRPSKDKSCEDNEWRQLNTLFFMNDSVGEWLILTVTAKKLNKIIYVTPKKLINCINLFLGYLWNNQKKNQN